MNFWIFGKTRIGGLTGDLVQCLECGRWFRAFGSHLRTAHGMTAAEYRERHDLPASHKLAGNALREAQSARTSAMIADGTLRNDPAAASEAARGASRGLKCSHDRARQAEHARAMGLGNTKYEPGELNAAGRDAVKVRESQRRRRKSEKGA